MIEPCKNCTKRNVTENYNCHTDCMEYKKQQEEYKKIRAYRKRRSEFYQAKYDNSFANAKFDFRTGKKRTRGIK